MEPNITSLLKGNGGVKGVYPLPSAKNNTDMWNPLIRDDTASKSVLPLFSGKTFTPRTIQEISDYATGKSSTLPGGGSVYPQTKQLSATAASPGGAQTIAADSSGGDSEMSELRERQRTINEQIDAAKRMASYSGTGGADMYASVQKTLESTLRDVNTKINNLTSAKNTAAGYGTGKSTIENSAAVGYNGSEIDPVELITGFPGIGVKSAYPGNPQIAANYGAQTYPGQVFDNIQKLTSGAGTSGAAAQKSGTTVGYNGSWIDPVELIMGIPGIGAENLYPGNPQIAEKFGAQAHPGQVFDNIQKMASGAGNAGAASSRAAAQTAEESAADERTKDLREQNYRYDLLGEQIEIAKKTEAEAKTGDEMRAARAVRDSLKQEQEKVGAKIASLEAEEDSYLERSAKQVLYGNYSDDVTLLGTAGQIGLGLTGLDFLSDIRDLTYDLTHWDGSMKHAGQTLLDVVGLIPGIGALKNADEVAALIKQALNSAPALADGAKYALKNVGLIAAGITDLFKNSDELATAGKAAMKTADDTAREYQAIAKSLLGNTDEAADAAKRAAAKEAEFSKEIDDAWKAATEGAAEGAGDAWGSPDDLIKAAITPGKGGVSPVGRAFQKHAGNPSRAGTFVGEISGNAVTNTEQGSKYISDILNNPRSTYTTRTTKTFGEVLDVRLPDGTGARWSADGKIFIMFLEKYTPLK